MHLSYQGNFVFEWDMKKVSCQIICLETLIELLSQKITMWSKIYVQFWITFMVSWIFTSWIVSRLLELVQTYQKILYFVFPFLLSICIFHLSWIWLLAGELGAIISGRCSVICELTQKIYISHYRFKFYEIGKKILLQKRNLPLIVALLHLLILQLIKKFCTKLRTKFLPDSTVTGNEFELIRGGKILPVILVPVAPLSRV